MTSPYAPPTLAWDPIPWRRQPIDTTESFALFQVYLGLEPPRRVSDVVRHFRRAGRRDVTLERVEEACEQGRWERRAELWDERIVAAQEHARLDLAAEEGRAAARQLRLADLELAKWERMSLEQDRPILEPRVAARLRREATADRRVARGEVSTRVAVKPELRAELEGRSTEDLLAIVRAAQAARSGASK